MNNISTSIILFTIFLIAKICFSQDNTLEESQKYWQMRANEAKRRLMQAYHPEPFNVTNHFNLHTRKIFETNNTRRSLIKKYKGPCEFRNPIDACWRCRRNWEKNRQHLAKCAIGFGAGTTGGLGGRIYVVSDSSDNDMVNPKPGTLRHAVIQEEPLWIIFASNMAIRLNQELIMTSNKTIDGRGAHVVITHGAGITIQYVENVIIHGIKIREIVAGSGGIIRDSINHYGFRTQSDGDAISIFGSHHVWIDHVSMSKTYDGLIDIIKGSTAITISNCHMTQQDKVFLFGASKLHYEDRNMQITIAYTHFGKGLTERMPRVRYGFFHVVNNDYTHWEMYAIGGSENPTIISQGNRFIAPNLVGKQEVTHRERPNSEWDSGTWISEQDLLLNGATFLTTPNAITPQRKGMIAPMPGSSVGRLTFFSGPLKCVPNRPC